MADITKAKNQFKMSLGTELLSGALDMFSSVMNAKTSKRYGEMQKKAYDAQARLNTLATERNIGYQTRQTAQAINQVYREGNKARGRQLAAMAASGMSTASGSGQALLKSTGISVGRDVSTLQANLANSAYEQRRANNIENIMLAYQGAEAESIGKQQATASVLQGVSGLLSSIGSVAGKWQTYQDELASIRGENIMQTAVETPVVSNPLDLVSVSKMVAPVDFSPKKLMGTTGKGLANFMDNYEYSNQFLKRARNI